MGNNLISLGVLVSGSGSNLQAIIDRIEAHTLNARIAVVISSDPKAFALQRAKQHEIPIIVLQSRDYVDREAADDAMVAVLNKYGVELVILAGFMRILSQNFLRAFPMRIMNIHPALLPSFPGIHGQKKAVDYGIRFSGCTVHFADEGVDTGPIIIQAVVPVHDDDTEESLAARILAEEHRIYPQAIQWYTEKRLYVEGRKVRVVDGIRCHERPVHNPPLES